MIKKLRKNRSFCCPLKRPYYPFPPIFRVIFTIFMVLNREKTRCSCSVFMRQGDALNTFELQFQLFLCFIGDLKIKNKFLKNLKNSGQFWNIIRFFWILENFRDFWKYLKKIFFCEFQKNLEKSGKYFLLIRKFWRFLGVSLNFFGPKKIFFFSFP